MSGGEGLIRHPFDPVWNADSRVLILGSFPSVKSREDGFYYGHPQNRFWKVISAVFDREAPHGLEEKKALLFSCGLALWDTVASCSVTGSADASIRNAQPNDLDRVLSRCPIRMICCNGKTAYETYRRLILPVTGREALCLPSTSPANAVWTLPKLVEAWRVIREAD